MARHGTVNDLALYTLGMNVRVAVIPTSRIFNNTPDEKLVESVVLASVPGECDKSRVICAVLHKNHFDLGVLRTSGSVQAVFQVGKEWDDALQRLLSFIKSRSPPPEPKREDLGPRWVPPTSLRQLQPGRARGYKARRFICAGPHSTHHSPHK